MLKVRIDAHRGVSYRAGCPFNVKEHSYQTLKCKYTIIPSSLKIVFEASNKKPLRLLKFISSGV